jgi:hypothetical protein
MARGIIVGSFLVLLTWLAGLPSAEAGLKPLTERPEQVSEQDWQNARGMRTGDKDLRLAAGGHYVGGLDRVWWLVVTGPPASKFQYSFMTIPGIVMELQGTYEVKEGLAWFSGTRQTGETDVQGNLIDKKQLPGKPIRFALNYRILAGKPYFNLLCQDDKGHYQYERRWFRADARQWLPLEQHKMTFIPKETGDKQLKFLVKAELTRWDEQGKKLDPHFKEVTATYQRNGDFWYKSPNQPDWLALVLRPSDGNIGGEKLPACFHLETQHFGRVHGFDFANPPSWKSQ